MAKQMTKHVMGMTLTRTIGGGWAITDCPGNSDVVGYYIERNTQKFAFKWLVWNRIQQPRRIVGKSNTMHDAILDATKTWGCTHCADLHTSCLDVGGELHYRCKGGSGRYYLVWTPENDYVME